MGRIRRMLVPIIAADKSDYTPVQNNNSSTAYYELLKAFNVAFKVQISDPDSKTRLQQKKVIEKPSAAR